MRNDGIPSLPVSFGELDCFCLASWTVSVW